jgi:hypothetical protein
VNALFETEMATNYSLFDLFTLVAANLPIPNRQRMVVQFREHIKNAKKNQYLDSFLALATEKPQQQPQPQQPLPPPPFMTQQQPQQGTQPQQGQGQQQQQGQKQEFQPQAFFKQMQFQMNPNPNMNFPSFPQPSNMNTGNQPPQMQPNFNQFQNFMAMKMANMGAPPMPSSMNANMFFQMWNNAQKQGTNPNPGQMQGNQQSQQ